MNTEHTDTKTRSSRVRRGGVVTLVTGALVLATPGLASATTGPAGDGTDLRPRLERACLRVPNLQIRTDRLIERIQAGPETLGSLQWLQVQIDKARAADRDQLATVLQNRYNVRVASLEVLRLRADALDDVEQFCVDLGVEL